ncbi:MAG: trans-sulfuration enzyme family protein [Candidatus Asgardarchaeia archaeon]
MKNEKGFSTKSVHAGEFIEKESGAVIVPIYQTSTFLYPREDKPEEESYIYTRIRNPTLEAAEKKIAALEGAEAGLVFSSGLSAIHTTLSYFLKPGDHIIYINDVYGGTEVQLKLLEKYGIERTQVIIESDFDALLDAIRENTKLIYFETPTNPLLRITDIKEVAKIAKEHGIITVADNTFATPINQQPLLLGIDVVVYSVTKYLNGHSDIIGGAIVGPANYMSEMLQLRRAFGGIMDPFAGFLLLRGMKTLAVRMAMHNKNGMAVAEFLEDHPKIERVYYPGLTSHISHEIAKKQMRGYGGMVSFEVKGNAEETYHFMKNLKIATIAVSLGLFHK